MDPDLDGQKSAVVAIRRFRDAGRYADALNECVVYLEQNPSSSEIMNELAHVQYAMGDLEGAITAATSSIDICATDARIRFARARWLLMADRLLEAISDLTWLLELEDRRQADWYRVPALIHRAIAHLHAGAPERAAEDCRSLAPDVVVFFRGRLWRTADVEDAAIAAMAP